MYPDTTPGSGRAPAAGAGDSANPYAAPPSALNPSAVPLGKNRRISLKYLLFSLKGRIGRKAFWLGFGIWFLVRLVQASVVYGVDAKWRPGLEWYVVHGDPFSVECIIYTLAFGLPAMALIITLFAKRLQDRNCSAWWLVLLPLGTFFSWYCRSDVSDFTPRWFVLTGSIMFSIPRLWLFILCAFFRGTPGPNRYGPDPR